MRRTCLTACALLAVAVAWPRAPAAQPLVPEMAALRERSLLRLTTSALASDSEAEADGTAGRSETRQTFSRGRGLLGVVLGPLRVGGAGEQLRFSERTAEYEVDESRDDRAAYVGWVVPALLSGADRLAVVASNAARRDAFSFQDYRRRIEADTTRRLGLAYELGFVRLGVAEGRETLTLRIDDPGRPLIAEDYAYRFVATTAGLAARAGGFAAALTAERVARPAVEGDAVDKAAATRDATGLRMGYNAAGGAGLFVEAMRWRLREAFGDEHAVETRAQAVSVDVYLGVGLILSATQTVRRNRQRLTLTGVPIDFRSTRRENALSLTVRF